MVFLLASVATAFIGGSSARAEWPDRPIKMIVPFSAGSSSDTIARIVAIKMGERLGQQVVVENRVGGSTIIGTDSVAKSAPTATRSSSPTPRPCRERGMPHCRSTR
jgi:tripartite-type tricarboxylate transporter receptor subunit TctC